MKDFVKKNSFTKRMVALMLVLLMLVTLIPSDLSLKAEGESSGNTLFDGTSIIMSSMTFDATYQDENGQKQVVTVVQGDMTELPANATISLMMNFLLQDGTLVQSGKDYVYNVPKGIRVDRSETLALTMDGEDDPIGDVVISKDGTLTFHFDTDVIGSSQGVHFFVGFGGGLSDTLSEKDSELKIQFPTGGASFDFDIKSLGDTTPGREEEGPNAVINKSGSFVTGEDGKKYVEWTVSLRNKNGDVIEGDIIDNLPAGLTYAGNVTVNGQTYPSISGNSWNYNAENGAPKMNVTTSNGDKSVTIHVENCKPDWDTKVTFLTVMDENQIYGGEINNNTSQDISNTATFNPSDGKEGVSSTTTINKKPNLLSKAKGAVDADGNVEWTITVNADKMDISGAAIEDTWENGTFVGDSVSVQKSDGTVLGTINVAQGATGFTYTVPADCTDTLTIKYKTHITQMESESKNTVTLKKDGVYNLESSASVPGAYLIKKDGLGYDPISQTVSWRITVNESARPLKNVVVEDIFPGDLMNRDTVTVNATSSVGSWSVASAGTNPKSYNNPQSITFNLGDISDTVYITITMKVSDSVTKGQSYNFQNYTKLTSSTLTNPVDDDASIWATIEDVRLAQKWGQKTTNKEGYLTWIIEVKGQKQRPESYTIKDYLPANMEYVQGSFRLQGQYYDGNPSYKPQVSVITTGQDGQKIDEPYIAYTFDPVEDARFLDMVGNGGSFWIAYETKAKNYKDSINSITYENKVDVTANFPNNVNVTQTETASVTETLGGILGKDYAYKGGTNEVTWIVKINEAKTDMSQIKNPTIKDQLEDYLEYKAGSGKLYLVNADGTKTAVPDTNYQVAVVNNLVTVMLPNIATNNYEFEFTTRFKLGPGEMSKIKVNNKVDLVGDGMIAQKQTSDVTNISFSSSVAGASVKRQIRVKKVDASSGKVLEGATFELYLPGITPERDVLIGKAVTGKDGYAVFEETDSLIGKTIKLKETETPPGYDYLATTTNTGDTTSEKGITTITNFTEANIRADEKGQYYEIIIKNKNENDVTTADIKLKKVDAAKTTTVLPNAVYGLYTDEDCTTMKGVAKATDTTGYVTFGNIPEGTYWLKEITPPDGYKLSEQKVAVVVAVDNTVTPSTVTVTYDGNVASEVQVTDTKATGTLTITKIESGSKDRKRIEGVTFEIYKDEACTLKVASEKTDENGTAKFENLELGKTYWYKETEAPNDYVLDETVKSIRVGTGTETTDQVKKIDVYNSLKLGNIVITKQDDSVPARRLAGVQFTLYNANADGNATTAYQIADADGNMMNYVVTTDANGKATFEDIPFGSYVVKETQGKTNYIVATDTQVVVNKTEDTELTIINKAERFSVKINKQPSDNLGSGLQGAEFTLYNDKGVAVRTGTTNSLGVLEFADIPLREYTGNYILKETKTPDGYITAPDKTITYTEIMGAARDDKTDAHKLEYSIIDEKQAGKVLLRKVDADDTTKGLSGAEYVLMDEDGNIVQTTDSMTAAVATQKAALGVTGAQEGSIYFENIKFGTYYIVETKAPVFDDKVYIRDEKKYKVVIKSNDETVTEVTYVDENGVTQTNNTGYFTNVVQPDALPIVSFKLKKVDNADPANPIHGAVFKLYKNDPSAADKSGADAEGFVDTGITGVSGTDGMVYFRRISVDDDSIDTTYRIVETETLFGYKKSDIKYTITKRELSENSKDYVDKKPDDPNTKVETRKDDEICYLPTANASGHLDGTANISETNGLTVVNEKLYGSIQLTKQGATSNVKLAGATFYLYDIERKQPLKVEGSERSATTNAQGIALFENLPFGTYYLRERVPVPDGYLLSNEIIRVEVNQESAKGAIPVTVSDERIDLYISKQELGFGAEVPGATIVLKEKNSGTIIDQWVSGTDAHHIAYGKLKINTDYTLEETAAPSGYGYTKIFGFSIDSNGKIQEFADEEIYHKVLGNNAIILYDDAVALTVTKVEEGTSNPISGARLAIYDEANNEVYRWTTGATGDCEVGSKLTIPKSGYNVYTLKERFAPMEYMLAKPIQFAVGADAKVYEYENGTVGPEITNGIITMVDAKKSGAFFRKVDAETYADIEGAKLAIYDVTDGGETLVGLSWISDGTPKHFGVTRTTPVDDDLVVGNIYEFRELSAPAGYAEAQPVKFKITGIDADGKAVIEVLENGNEDSLNYDGDTLLMLDKKVTLKLKKQDTFGQYLPDAVLEVYEYDFDTKRAGTKLADITTGKTIIEVDNTKLKLDGYYLIKETAAPDGFGYADDIVVHIREDGVAEAVMTISRLDGAFLYDNLPVVYENVVYVTDIDNVVSIGKLDADDLMNGKTTRVANSMLKLTSDNDRFFEEVVWSSNDKASESFDMLKFTPGCSYTLTEIGAPDGYAYTDPINFRIDGDTREVWVLNDDGTETRMEKRTVYISDAKINLNVAKMDALSGEPVAGAKFRIVDADGAVVASWTSKNEIDTIDTSKLKAGDPEYLAANADYKKYAEYTIQELEAPAGYEKAADVTFAIDGDGKMYHVTVDEDGQKQYTLFTVTAGGIHVNLIGISDEPQLKISKVDIMGEEVPNATLTIYAKDGSVDFEPIIWSTGEAVGEPKYISKNVFTPYVEYVLEEVVAPNGYTYAHDITFYFDENGMLYVDGVAMDGSREINMVDELINVVVSKQDEESTNEVKGASLAIRDSKGEVIYTFESDVRPTLLPSDIFTAEKGMLSYYTLEELIAPEGYLMAAPVKFAIDDSGTIYIADENGKYQPAAATNGTVVMKDARDPNFTSSKVVKGPNTGDNMPIIPIVVLCIAALGGMILIIRKKLVM
ncbi:MAG: SpaA isopeptide-forming pilin-related protein [Clostridium sp.]|nr:SpaA isopeptide-forming pilin-related protein [Clostridium sp.]